MIVFDAQASPVSLAFFDMYSAREAPIDVFILLTDIYIYEIVLMASLHVFAFMCMHCTFMRCRCICMDMKL